MITCTWKTVKSVLAGMKTPVPPQDAEVFWQEFRKEASKAPALTQAEPIKTSPVPFPFQLIVLSGAVGAVLLLVMAVRTFIFPSSQMTQIKSLNITVPHQAVFLVSDSTRRITILWISGMEEN